MLGYCQLFQSVVVRLSPTCTQPAALIAFVYLIYKANPDKCHFLFCSDREVSLIIENQKIKISKFEKLLGIKLNSKWKFNSHIHEICPKAGHKLNATLG